MKLLTRYVIREHVGPLIFALSALTTIMLINQVAKQFGNLVGKGLGWGVIGELFYLSLPFIVAMTLPMAVLVAVLYAFSQLAADNEVTALRASGVSVARVVTPVLCAGAVLAVLMLLFNDQVLSRANHKLRTLQTAIARKKPTFALREQVMNEVIPGKLFLRTGHIDPATNKLREVFIYNFEDPTRRKTIYADSGQMGLTRDESTLEMTLHHGYVLEVARDDPGSLQRLYFGTDVVRVRGVANKFENADQDSYKGEREMSICEMSKQYQSGAYSLDVARADLATMIENTTTYLTTGVQPLVKRAAPAKMRPTSGQVYCDLISRVFGGAQTAEAAEVAQQPVSRQAAQQPVSRKPAGQQPVSRKPASPTQQPRIIGPRGLRRMAVPQNGENETRPSARPVPQSKVPARQAPPIRPPQERLTSAAQRIAPPSLGFTSVPQLEVARARITDARSTVSRYEVEIQKKFALAAACIVFVLFGAPIALRFPRGGVGVVIVVSIVA
ncbi:MAG: LptF/LptG family permease, partial [Gemmatimonadaceae bacterium]